MTTFHEIWLMSLGVHVANYVRTSVSDSIGKTIILSEGVQNTITFKTGSNWGSVNLDSWRCRLHLFRPATNERTTLEITPTSTSASYSWTPSSSEDYVLIENLEVEGRSATTSASETSVQDALEILCSDTAGNEYNIRIDGLILHNYVTGAVDVTLTLTADVGQYVSRTYGTLTINLTRRVPFKITWKKLAGASVTSYRYKLDTTYYDGILVKVEILDENYNTITTINVEITTDEGETSLYDMPSDAKYMRYTIEFEPKEAVSTTLQVVTNFKLTP